MLQVLNVLLGDLDITLKLEDVDKVLSLVGQLLLEQVDLLWGAGVVKFVDDVEEHGVFVGLLHDFGDLIVEILEKGSGGMVDDVEEGLEADTTLSDISVEQTDTDDDVRELAELSDLLRGGQGDEWSETGSWEDGFEGGGNFTLDCVRNRGVQLDRGIVADDVLLVLIEQVVENLFIKKGNTLEVVTRSWLEADDLVDESVRLMAEVCDVLLTLDLLFHIGRIVTDLKLDGVE